MVAHVFPRIIS